MYMDSCCTYTEQGGANPGYTFSGLCIQTKKIYSVFVKSSELFDFRSTGSISSFCSLSPADREFLMTGLSPEGWEEVMSNTEDYDGGIYGD